MVLSARSVSIFADQECMSCEQDRKLRASSQRAILLKISRTRIEASRRTVPHELPPPAVRMTAPFAFLLPPARTKATLVPALGRKESFRPAAEAPQRRNRGFCRSRTEIAVTEILQMQARRAGIASAGA
jgi:hypothetical protein